jgi:hypothetical protein
MPEKSMKKEPKIVLPSLVAPLASLLVPALLAIFTKLTDSATQNDDAPVRAAGLLLIVVLPLTYPILALFMGATGYILKKVQKFTFKNLLIVYGVACIPIAVRFGWPSPFGLKDQIIGLAIFFPLTVVCMVLGAFCWWFIGVGHNPFLHRTPNSRRL